MLRCRAAGVWSPRELRDRARSVPGLDDLVPRAAQPVGDRLVDHRLVLDDEDPEGRSADWHGASLAGKKRPAGRLERLWPDAGPDGIVSSREDSLAARLLLPSANALIGLRVQAVSAPPRLMLVIVSRIPGSAEVVR
jgi:hypothetical protein